MAFNSLPTKASGGQAARHYGRVEEHANLVQERRTDSCRATPGELAARSRDVWIRPPPYRELGVPKHKPQRESGWDDLTWAEDDSLYTWPGPTAPNDESAMLAGTVVVSGVEIGATAAIGQVASTHGQPRAGCQAEVNVAREHPGLGAPSNPVRDKRGGHVVLESPWASEKLGGRE